MKQRQPEDVYLLLLVVTTTTVTRTIDFLSISERMLRNARGESSQLARIQKDRRQNGYPPVRPYHQISRGAPQNGSGAKGCGKDFFL
jgi:hypothetical protein